MDAHLDPPDRQQHISAEPWGQWERANIQGFPIPKKWKQDIIYTGCHMQLRSWIAEK